MTAAEFTAALASMTPALRAAYDRHLARTDYSRDAFDLKVRCYIAGFDASPGCVATTAEIVAAWPADGFDAFDAVCSAQDVAELWAQDRTRWRPHPRT